MAKQKETIKQVEWEALYEKLDNRYARLTENGTLEIAACLTCGAIVARAHAAVVIHSFSSYYESIHYYCKTCAPPYNKVSFGDFHKTDVEGVGTVHYYRFIPSAVIEVTKDGVEIEPCTS